MKPTNKELRKEIDRTQKEINLGLRRIENLRSKINTLTEQLGPEVTVRKVMSFDGHPMATILFPSLSGKDGETFLTVKGIPGQDVRLLCQEWCDKYGFEITSWEGF